MEETNENENENASNSQSGFHHVLSVITALYILIFLYFPPHVFYKIVFSPVLLITSTLLIAILRYGAEEKHGKEESNQTEVEELDSTVYNEDDRKGVKCEATVCDPDPFLEDVRYGAGVKYEKEGCNRTEAEDSTVYNEGDGKRVKCKATDCEPDTLSEDVVCGAGVKYEKEEFNWTEGEEFYFFEYNEENHEKVTCKPRDFDPEPFSDDCFVGWNVKAPLEVIYEAYEEGEDREGEENSKKKQIERYPSLSFYYPDSDSDSNSNSSDCDFMAAGDWGSPKRVSFRWEDDEEEREGLIEISLDGSDKNNNCNNKNVKKKKNELEFGTGNFHGEEENNLIEIDISPVANGRKWRFSGEAY